MQGDGEWGLQSAHNSSSLQLLPPHISSLLHPPQAAVLQGKPSAMCAPLCRPVFPQGIFTCSDVGVLNRLQGNTCSTMAHSICNRQTCFSTWGTSSHSLFSDLGTCRIPSHTCTSSVLTACVFYSFLNVLSQKCHQFWWQDQLRPGEGPCWTWLDPAMSVLGQPPVFQVTYSISLIANTFIPTSSANSTLKMSNEYKS